MNPLNTIIKGFTGAQKVASCFCFALLVTACGEDQEEKLSPERIQVLTSQAVKENNQIIATSSELLNIKNSIFNEEGINLTASYNGRLGNPSSCDPIVTNIVITDETHYDTLIYAGKITIDYKDGSVCALSDKTRKGKVVIDFTYIINYRNNISYSSRETISFVDFAYDTVTFNGRLTCLTALNQPTTLETQAVKITYPDNTTSTWQGKLFCLQQTPAANMELSGTLEGVTRRGHFYKASIKSPLSFASNCTAGLPASGTVDVQVNQALATMDYGNGQCDEIYAITALTEAP